MDEKIPVGSRYHKAFKEYKPRKHPLFPAGMPDDDQAMKKAAPKPASRMSKPIPKKNDGVPLDDWQQIAEAISALEVAIKPRPTLEHAERRVYSLARTALLLRDLRADELLVGDLLALVEFLTATTGVHCEVATGGDG